MELLIIGVGLANFAYLLLPLLTAILEQGFEISLGSVRQRVGMICQIFGNVIRCSKQKTSLGYLVVLNH